MKIFSVIVTYNGREWYDKCIGSLLESSVPVTPIVVDNASSDGAVDYIRSKFPSAIVIPSNENLGFAKANNIGIRYAIDHGADYVFLLNQDAWVEKDTVEKLVGSFEKHENIGIACPINLNAAKTAMDYKSVTDMPGDYVSDLYFGNVKDVYDVRFFCAASWMISADCIRKVGGFDTNLFKHYGEDNNYCQRVKYHGMRIVVNTQCTMCHDREFRKVYEGEYRNRNFKQNDTSRSIEFGDITSDIDIDSFINSLKKSIRKSYTRFRFSKIKLYKNELAFFEMVKKSRDANSQGGMVWL